VDTENSLFFFPVRPANLLFWSDITTAQSSIRCHLACMVLFLFVLFVYVIVTPEGFTTMVANPCCYSEAETWDLWVCCPVLWPLGHQIFLMFNTSSKTTTTWLIVTYIVFYLSHSRARSHVGLVWGLVLWPVLTAVQEPWPLTTAFVQCFSPSQVLPLRVF